MTINKCIIIFLKKKIIIIIIIIIISYQWLLNLIENYRSAAMSKYTPTFSQHFIKNRRAFQDRV